MPSKETSGDLKPCPFCGTANPSLYATEYAHQVWCECCDAEGPPANEREAAISSWNRRTA